MKPQCLSRRLILIVPLLLIFFTTVLLHWLFDESNDSKLRLDSTYEVWISEAEVSPARADGTPWDSDGSAPDLQGMIVWHDQRILETVVASDGLIARWEPVGVKLSHAVRGEVDAASLRRVAHIRVTDGAFLEVGVLDDDMPVCDFAGAFRVLLSSLRLGANEIRAQGGLIRLQIVVAEPGREPPRVEMHAVRNGITILAEPPAVMGSPPDRLLKEIEKATEGLTEEIEKGVRQLGEEADSARSATMDWLESRFGK